MKVLFAYIQRKPRDREVYERIAASAPPSLEVVPFAMKCSRVRWPDLDRAWRTRDAALLDMYELMYAAATECDALMLYNGWNLHPDFVALLPTFNVYCFFDDPESSEKQSRHVAPAFDAVFFGNIASQPQYASWGCQRLAHLPIFFDPAGVPAPEDIRAQSADARDNDIVLCCGMTSWRRSRLDGLVSAFPDARVHGSGWPAGWLEHEEQQDLYRRSKIGWNIHNSTGPINQRLHQLAAWGIMQICDNKTGLGMFYDLGREVAGFDTIPEAIELTRHYLDHDDERRAMAAAALDRFQRDYHPTQTWVRIEKHLREWGADAPREDAAPALRLPHNSPVIAPLRSVQRGLGRWGRRQQESAYKSNYRRRFGHGPEEWDESIYVGRHPAYRPGGTPVRPGPRAGFVRAARPDDVQHAEARSWALTSLLGDARRIGVLGERAQRFIELAGLDSMRKVEAIAETGSGLDLLVWPFVTLEELSDATETDLLASTPRLVVAIDQAIPAADNASDEVYRVLSGQFAEVRLCYLPDPLVPWIEPLDGASPASPVIAACRRETPPATMGSPS